MRLEARDRTRLLDILRHGQEAIDALARLDYPAFAHDRLLVLAMERCCEIIGEAGRHVSDPVRQALPSIPWHAMYGMRNRLTHDYANASTPIIFRVIKEELPPLVERIELFLQEHESL